MDTAPRTQVESLRYLRLMAGATEFEQTREAMAFREDVMKQRLEALLAETDESHLVVLLAHAFHLAKDDAGFVASSGVGPGGGQASSLGHYLTQDCRVDARAVWMIYGAGEDSQPIEGLPTTLDYPTSSINHELRRTLTDVTLLPAPPPAWLA